MIYLAKPQLSIRIVLAVLVLAPAGFAGITAAARAGPARRSSRSAVTPTRIGSRGTKAGWIVAGPRGQTLFLFNHDMNGTSGCYGRCARNWRPLLAFGRVVAQPGSGVKQRWLSTTRRRHGGLQVTYERHPLYINVGYTRPGSLNGDGANEFGGRWYAIPIDGVKRTCVGHC